MTQSGQEGSSGTGRATEGLTGRTALEDARQWAGPNPGEERGGGRTCRASVGPSASGPSVLRSVSWKTPSAHQRSRLTGLAQRPEGSSALCEASEVTVPTTAAL